MIVRFLNQGDGFGPNELADPLVPENLLKSNSRGIFFMQCFMDDLALYLAPESGLEARMVNKF